MAIYYLGVKVFGRARGKHGSVATSAAAYRAGERIHDERTGRTYDHTGRQDVLHAQILLPSRFAGVDMPWARDRARLWNAAELAESRKDARVAREYLVALPIELTSAQRLDLVRRFAQGIADRYQNAVDVAIHAPRPESDPRNYHAHLLATTREVTAEGLGLKTTLEINSLTRQQRGLEPVVNEYLYVRERWAELTNESLRNAGVDARVDHRSLADQGVENLGEPRIPVAALEIERRGERSHVAERIRGEHAARLEALTEKSAKIPGREGLSLEAIRRKAREDWLAMRSQKNADHAAGADPKSLGTSRDEDLAF